MKTRNWIAATPAAHRTYGQQDLQRDLKAVVATGVPGVLAEVRTGGRTLRGTSGVANLSSRKPVSPNGFFRVGSVTKTFTSVVTLQLAAEPGDTPPQPPGGGPDRDLASTPARRS